MKSSHNKKRNIGLVYELILRSISSSLIEGDSDRVNTSLEIMKRRFGRDTEIYSEFRIFDAIMNTTVTDTTVAAGIITEAKAAIRRIDYSSLHKEKSILISEINKTINDKSFFKRRVPNYREFATIGIVINQWRELDKSNLTEQVINEQRLIEFMMKEKTVNQKAFEDMKDENADNLVIKLMTETINSRYDDLSNEQKMILQQYALYSTEDNQSQLSEYLGSVKMNSIKMLNELKDSTDNKIILSKIDAVVNKVKTLKESNVSDSDLSKYLVVSDLKKELGVL